MPLPLFAAAIVGAVALSRRTESRDVTTAAIFNGKNDYGNGYNEGTQIGTATYGSIDNASIGGSSTISCIGYNENAAPDTFEFWLNTTGYSAEDLIQLVVETSSGDVTLDYDANVSFGTYLGDTYWKWNATDHTLPNWTADIGNVRTVTITYRSGW